MTPQQVTEAQKLAREWKPKKLTSALELSCKEIAYMFQKDKTEKEREARLQEIRERRELEEFLRREYEARRKKGSSNDGDVRTELERYYGLLGQRVRNFWTVPINLTDLQKLSVTIAVDVARDGSVRGLKIERASGNQGYDEAALRAVKLASTPAFPAPPKSVKESWLALGFRFCGANFCR